MTRSADNPRREPLNLLILLGFFCQGFSFDNVFLRLGVLTVYVLTWSLCLRHRRPRSFLPAGVEEGVTLLAIYGAYAIGGDYGYNKLVFIGNAMVAFQALRLLRPLTAREKMYSVAVALIQLAVGSQVIVDYEFILVLAAALYLVPRTLLELEAEKYVRVAAGGRPALGRPVVAALVAIMVLFFLFFPRFSVSRYGGRLTGPAFRQKDELEMSESGGEPRDYLLFRIEGDKVSYIKRTALDVWNGRTWRKSGRVDQAKRFPRARNVEGAWRRSVKILNYKLVGHALPVDGYVLRIEGPFIQRPYVAEHGGAMAPYKRRRNVTYEYWTRLDRKPDPISDRARRHYLAGPGPGDRVRDWLGDRVGAEQDPYQVAADLVQHFRENYEYRVGAPALDQLEPLEDFVFNQREGHCGRFASALGVLLRARGIPTRVALGWVAVEKNELGGFFNVRARHAHAWTEAWIDGRGWVNVDATPYGEEFPLERRPLGLTLYEWLEFVWYAKIVEFDVSEQRSFLDFAGKQIQLVVTGLTSRLPVIGAVLLMASLAFAAARLRQRRGRVRSRTYDRRKSLVKARHFYGRMLRILARQRHCREPGQTPFEFLKRLTHLRHPALVDIRDVTLCFCEIRYGNRELTGETELRMQGKLARIAKGRAQGEGGK